MRHLMFVLVASVCLVAGCGEIDTVVDATPAPDAGLPMGDGSMFMGDAGPVLVDSGLPSMTDTGADAGAPSTEDASVPGLDASESADAGSVVGATCGNAVLDPGEICDPGHLVHDDAGVHVEISSPDMHMCPACTAVVCPSDDVFLGGPVAGQSYCAYLDTGGASSDPEVLAVRLRSSRRLMTWRSASERDAQFTALRSGIWPARTQPMAMGHIDVHHLTCLGVAAWHWHDCFGPVATALPPFGDRYPDHDGILSLTQTAALLFTTASTVSSYSYLLVDAPNAAP